MESQRSIDRMSAVLGLIAAKNPALDRIALDLVAENLHDPTDMVRIIPVRRLGL